MSKMKAISALFVRGGTSNGLVFHRSSLPDPSRWQTVLASAMGSPDPYGRQLNGMGSGASSTSKVCIVEKSTHPHADVDFTFVQVGIADGSLDLAGNCGNLSSVIGPFAVDEGVISARSTDRERTTVRIFNTNTSKIIYSTFAIDPLTKKYNPLGDYAIDGVPGTGSLITLSFIDPAGAKTGSALPTGNAVDILDLSSGEQIAASLVDIANPGVFVLADDVKIAGNITPDMLNNDKALMARLEQIRRAGAVRMGLDPDTQSVPKIVILSPTRSDDEADITCRALSMQQAHKAVPLTLALNLGAACRLPGTLPHRIVRKRGDQSTFNIAHASGRLEVGSILDETGQIESAVLQRTARVLMKGEVYYVDDDV